MPGTSFAGIPRGRVWGCWHGSCEFPGVPFLFLESAVPHTTAPRSLPLQVGAFVNDAPATEAEARAAFTALGWCDVEAEDVEQGVWLVAADRAFRRRVQRSGHAVVSVGEVDVHAELP